MTYLQDPSLTATDINGGAALGPDAPGEATQALLLTLFKDRARRFGFRLEEAFQAEQAKGEGTFDDAFNLHSFPQPLRSPTELNQLLQHRLGIDRLLVVK